MAEKAVVVGSGAGGSVAAMVLAETGYNVVVLERGPNVFDDISNASTGSRFGADELSGPIRRFEYPDSIAEPRVFEHRELDGHRVVGEINALPSLVGGGTVHWDAKTPRFWDIDFAKLSILGPVEGADIVDWPFSYADIAPYYDEIEELLGVQGSVSDLPQHLTLRHAPRSGDFPMRPGPPQYSSQRIAEGAKRLGLHPFPMQMAINSERHGGRPPCVNCGFCCGFGCPSQARASALAGLRRAVLAGAEVREKCRVTRLVNDGKRVRAVAYVDKQGRQVIERADLVVLAASAIESCRLALVSELPDPHDLIGKGIMFHSCSVAYGLFLGETVYNHRGRNITHAFDDFADPDFEDAREVARARGLSYFRGGVVELGFGPIGPVQEGLLYRRLLSLISPEKPFGSVFKKLMRTGLLRRSMLGVMMHGEDVAQIENRVVLDPLVRDWCGVPVAKILYGPHKHEIVAQEYYRVRLAGVLRAAGATVVAATPEMRQHAGSWLGGPVPTDFHTLGGMRMGACPKASVVDEWGMVRGMENLLVVDGSVFPTSGGHNPTLTIMAVSLKITRGLRM